MRISVVADVHGNIEGLARVAESAEQLLILGDLLDYIDYHDPTRGIVGEMFGPDAAVRFARLRLSGNFAALRQFNIDLWSTIADPVETLRGVVRGRYQQIAQILPPGTIVTLGNVDVAAEWQHVAGEEFPYRDGEIVTIDGLRFGFVAGGARRIPLPSAPPDAAAQPTAWRPFMRTASEFRAALARIGATDVMCTHIPPNHALLRYDTVPARLEMFAPGLEEYLHRYQPQLALFGHVHQPLALQIRWGMTQCVNVGHFQRYAQPYIIDTEQLHAARDAR